MDYNRVILVGRVTADPQVRTTPGGQSVVTLGIATNRTWTDKAGAKQEETEFHNVVVWGRQAEIAGQYLTKGATVLIEGRIQTRSWTDKQGQARKTTEVMCERLQLGPRAGGGGGGGGSSSGGGFRGGASSGASSAGPSKVDDAPSLDEIPVINLEDEEIKPEDIPF
ncbi:MAG: single-stranded DNA-binding protein [Candidatus Pacebacteria bacterium]|nr:single-stranded DNA-binding protein [Candidatus Paceibacterota bacterium]